MYIMSNEYEKWNDTAVAHTFAGLITKTTSPFDTPFNIRRI